MVLETCVIEEDEYLWKAGDIASICIIVKEGLF